MKAKYCLLYTFLFISITVLSQKSYWTISGSLNDDKKVQIKSAIVFVNNTSIGTITNENGSFQLNIPNKFSQVELVICLGGFKTIKRKINYSLEVQVFKIQMEKVILSNEKSVSTKLDKDWKQKWKIFEKALLGDSEFARNCKILNPEVVKLVYDKDRKVIATAIEPVQIKNNALGYKILYQMNKLVSDGSTSHSSGLKYFEKIRTNNASIKRRWEKNRKDVFSDSFRNFLLALSLNKLEENDFEVYKIALDNTTLSGQRSIANDLKDGALIATEATRICTYDKETENFFIRSEYPLIIFLKKRQTKKPYFLDYPYKYSEIVLPRGYAEFTENGWPIRPNSIVMKYYWGIEGISNILPDDYDVQK